MTQHFLLIDDDIDDRELFVEALEKAGSTVSCSVCEDAREALKKLETKTIASPDVIFLDINLPVMSGWECLAWLKKSSQYKDIPVIMYSTSSHKRDREIAQDLGALCFFTKPNDYNQLVHFLKEIVEKVSQNAIMDIANYAAAV